MPDLLLTGKKNQDLSVLIQHANVVLVIDARNMYYKRLRQYRGFV